MDTYNIRDLSVEEFDTTTALAHANEQAIQRRYEDFLIVDVDSHHYETESYQEIVKYIEDPVLRTEAKYQGYGRSGLTQANGSYQEMAGRVTRYPGRKSEKVPPGPQHRDITLTKKWMDAVGIDIACLFPTPLLGLGLCARHETEVGLAQAYNRWLVDNVLAHEPRIKSMLYLPFNDPAACVRAIEEFGEKKGVIGFMVTAPHYRSVHDNVYMKTYAMLEERGLPLAFHSAFNWHDSMVAQTNRFITAHALGFTWFNMLHLGNWVINGLPERFPKLKVMWIESGLAWVPFMMQRFDNEFMMRSSDAPLLKRKPSDYMREMFFTTQPMEMVGNQPMLQATFDMVKADTQLLYASDYPHWDMDLPSTIYDLPFLDETAKRNILGENARRLFNFEPILSETKQRRLAARQAAPVTPAR